MVNYQAHRIITFICSLRALDRENVSTALDRCAAHKPHIGCAQLFDTTWHDSNFFALIPYDSKRDTILHLLWLVIDHILTASRELFLQNSFILTSYPRFVNQPLTTTTHITASSPLSEQRVVRRGYVRIGGMRDTLLSLKSLCCHTGCGSSLGGACGQQTTTRHHRHQLQRELLLQR